LFQGDLALLTADAHWNAWHYCSAILPHNNPRCAGGRLVLFVISRNSDILKVEITQLTHYKAQLRQLVAEVVLSWSAPGPGALWACGQRTCIGRW